MSNDFPPLGYPGNGYYYVICDVCGKKLRFKDSVQIRDKYNYLNGLIVCKADADKTNPQAALRARKERRNPVEANGEATDQFIYISSVSEIEAGDTSDPTGTAPGAPRYLQMLSVTATTARLQWIGPEAGANRAIQGYKVQRKTGEGAYSTVTDNSNSVAGYYEDTGLTNGLTYTYKVAAVNEAGTGSYSNECTIITTSA